MKKLVAISLLIGATLCFYSFAKSTSAETSIVGENVISGSEIWTHMQNKVFPKLEDLVDYKKKQKLFSRCPSGFSQNRDNSKGDDNMVYGIITFAEGCAREKFCYYEINWNTKDTKLKKKENDNYVAISTFVKSESQKIAKI